MSSPEGIAALVAAADPRAIARTFLATEGGEAALFDVLGAPRLAALLMAREDGVRAVEAAAEQHWVETSRQRERLARILHHVEPTALWRRDEDWEGGVVPLPREGEGEQAPQEPVSINEFMDDASMVGSASEDDEWSQMADATGSDTTAQGPATPDADGSSMAAQPSQAASDSPTRGTKRTREEEPQEEAGVRSFTPTRRIVRRRLSDGSAMRPQESTQSTRASSAPPIFPLQRNPVPMLARGDTPESDIAIAGSDDEASSERTL